MQSFGTQWDFMHIFDSIDWHMSPHYKDSEAATPVIVRL